MPHCAPSSGTIFHVMSNYFLFVFGKTWKGTSRSSLRLSRKMVELEVCGDKVKVSLWEGETLTGPSIAVEVCHVDALSSCPSTSSSFSSPLHTHRQILCLAVSTSKQHRLVQPCDIPLFLDLHKTFYFIFFDVAHQFWVMDEFLRSLPPSSSPSSSSSSSPTPSSPSSPPSSPLPDPALPPSSPSSPPLSPFSSAHQHIWWGMFSSCRVRDLQILDPLLKLASLDLQPTLADFEYVIEENFDLSPSKTIPFGEIAGRLIQNTDQEITGITYKQEEEEPIEEKKGRGGRKKKKEGRGVSSAMRKKKYHTRLMEEIAREGAEAQGVLRRVEKMGNVRKSKAKFRASFCYLGPWADEHFTFRFSPTFLSSCHPQPSSASSSSSPSSSSPSPSLSFVNALLASPSLLFHVISRPILVFFTYQKMLVRAITLMEPHSSEIIRGSVDLFGPLTEGIQIKSAITIPLMTYNGMYLDVETASKLQERMRIEMAESVNKIMNLPNCDDLFHIDVRGEIKYSKLTGKPSIIQDHLEERLFQSVREVRKRTGFLIPVPLPPGHGRGRGRGRGRGKGREQKEQEKPSVGDEEEEDEDDDLPDSMSLSRAKWKDYANLDSFIASWVNLEQTAKIMGFVSELEGCHVVHPTYTLFLRNGRTSCSSPNVQQVPRQYGLRSVFVASEGHLFLACDYSFIELCTLAAVCECRYGRSTLAHVIREGRDPHAYTAAMFEGVTLAEFEKLKKSDKEEDRIRYATKRQRAKAINFGIPGGQGAASLQEYAKSAYGVHLTLQEAKQFRERVIHEVYPELSTYLFEDKRFMQTLAFRLGCSTKECWEAFRNLTSEGHTMGIAGAVKHVIRGHPYDVHGDPYPTEFVEGVWACLRSLCNNREVLQLIMGSFGEGSEDLEEKLFGGDVTTMSGRLRGGVGFTQACNTPFSGLAADGAKLAIWDLVCAGYRVVAFVHDEVLLEIPEDCDLTREAAIVDQIMCDAMEQVCGSVPIKCKYSVSQTWTREAEPIWDGDVLIPWELRRMEEGKGGKGGGGGGGDGVQVTEERVIVEGLMRYLDGY